MHVKYSIDIRDIPHEAVEDCTRPGQDASESVECWMNKLGFTVDQEAARACLKGYGSWDDLYDYQITDDSEVASDETIASRIFWLACNDFSEFLVYAKEAGFNPYTDERPDDFDPSAGSDIFVLE